LAIASPFSVMIEDFPLTRIWPHLHRKNTSIWFLYSLFF
jgi:hypothetical protein